jgi:hypothetical protein
LTLEHLRSIVSPPAVPVGTGDPQRWQQVEARLGLRLPESRHASIERHDLSTRDFLAQVLEGRLPSDTFPDDLKRDNRFRFTLLAQ